MIQKAARESARSGRFGGFNYFKIFFRSARAHTRVLLFSLAAAIFHVYV